MQRTRSANCADFYQQYKDYPTRICLKKRAGVTESRPSLAAPAPTDRHSRFFRARSRDGGLCRTVKIERACNNVKPKPNQSNSRNSDFGAGAIQFLHIFRWRRHN
jgi:hypothetical protein